MKIKRAQGEIFGIALMFVVIIIGVIVYGQIKALNNTSSSDLQQEAEYKILAEGTLNTVLSMSTSCEVERNRDSLKDLINYCLENEYSGVDPYVECNDGYEGPACAHAVEILNETTFALFNSSDAKIGEIPFELKVDLPANKNSILSNVTLTNFGQFKYKNQTIDYENYRKIGYKRAPSGLITWSTAQRNIEFEFYMYYR